MAIDIQDGAFANGGILRKTADGTGIDDVTESDIVAAATQTDNTQTGTSYTLVLTDANKCVTLSNASGITLTVPPAASVAFAVGTRVDLIQLGVGQVTVAAGSGVTVNRCATFTLKLLEQYAEASLKKTATNTWVLTGVLEAV
jgi:hypothetical protein